MAKGAERAALDALQNPTIGPFLRGLVDRLGVGGARKVIQQGATMTTGPVDKIPVPRPQFGPGARPRSAPTSSNVPLQRSPIGTEGRYRPAPKSAEFTAVEPIEVEGQLKLGLTQPGKGARIYSPAKSSQSADVVEASMRSNLGDVMDAAGFPRYKAAEGQFAMDLEPSVTREMIQRMAPAISRAPGIPDPMRPTGVQVMDLSQIDPRVTGAIGAGAFAVGMDRMLRDAENKRVADLAQDMPAETKASESSDLPTAQEASKINELISSVVADASQQGGVYGELVLQNAPRDPSSYPSVLAYQAAQMQFLEDLASGTFTLAAKIEQQRQAESSLQSEQSGENVTTETLTSELGSDDMANAVGAGEAEAEAMMTPPALAGPIDTSTAAQGASDLATAATPRPMPETRMASTAMMESLQDQIAARIAQDSEAAMRAGMSPMAQRNRLEGDIRDRDIRARASYDPRFDRR